MRNRQAEGGTQPRKRSSWNPTLSEQPFLRHDFQGLPRVAAVHPCVLLYTHVRYYTHMRAMLPCTFVRALLYTHVRDVAMHLCAYCLTMHTCARCHHAHLCVLSPCTPVRDVIMHLHASSRHHMCAR
eukprot:jgi/Mesvir1/6842/Mv26509-RA.1